MKKRGSIIKIFIEYIVFILGDCLLAIGISLFLAPNNLSTGGFSGLATILNYYLGVGIGTFIIILNSFLILIAIFIFGYKFVLRTSISIVLYGMLTNILEVYNPITNDLLLASIIGGIFTGLGIALNLKVNSSTGGSDLLAKILFKYLKKISLSNFILVLDIIIIFVFVLVFKNIDYGLYSIIAIFISSKSIDIVLEGSKYATLVYIISEKNEIIEKEISEKMKRGVTIVNAIGYYSKDNKKIIYCAIEKHEIQIIKDIVNQNDKNAFVMISSVKEIIGEGFSK